MRDNIMYGLLAVTLLLTGINTYLISQDDAIPNLKPSKNSEKSQSGVKSNNAGKSKVTKNNRNNSNQKQKPGNTINNMSGNQNVTSMTFEKKVHDFGEILSTSENTYNFKFTNSGDKPLVINSANGSCGCTVPSYPKNPIAPGATEEIEVVYKPKGQSGPQTKRVTLTANTKPKKSVLTIKAKVNKQGG